MMDSAGRREAAAMNENDNYEILQQQLDDLISRKLAGELNDAAFDRETEDLISRHTKRVLMEAVVRSRIVPEPEPRWKQELREWRTFLICIGVGLLLLSLEVIWVFLVT